MNLGVWIWRIKICRAADQIVRFINAAFPDHAFGVIKRAKEVTGVAARFEKALDKLDAQLSEEFDGIRGATREEIGQFVMGVVERMRIQGAVFCEGLEGYINQGGRNYMFTRVPFLPNLGRVARSPQFFGLNRARDFSAFVSRTNKATWFEQWLEKVFEKYDPAIRSFSSDIFKAFVRILEEVDLFERFEVFGETVYGIKPDALLIGNEAVECVTEDGFERTTVLAPAKAYWDGMPSFRAGTSTRYRSKPFADNYYRDLFKRGAVKRVYSSEHTGLLKKQERKLLESRFSNPQGLVDPNLLSCTPTLEMGIDIGGLSSVALCSIPPNQANYAQRIGRAGRRDGNAFNLAIASGRPHDLYHYAEPDDMIQGAPDTPGVFLNAPAVLERQLVGYMFDRWVEGDLVAGALPGRMRFVLDAIEQGVDKRKFPFNFFEFIADRGEEMLSGFLELFEGELEESSIEYLKAYLSGGAESEPLVDRIKDAMDRVASERKRYKSRIGRLTTEINKIKNDPAAGQDKETDLKELTREKAALNALIADINNKQTFNFFTDEGLLPNYAFPESGVVLKSIILRKIRKADGDTEYKTDPYEYQRPGNLALTELAPSNSFYAHGRKIEIDQVDLRLSKVEEWRFCPSCAHSQEEHLVTAKDCCPNCGSPMWSDKNQKRSMVRLKQVMATIMDSKSVSLDESENREPTFYNKMMLVSVDRTEVMKAFRIADESLPFGFEYLRKASFREVNFGPAADQGEQLNIAGREVSKQGFKICKGCGKVKNGNSRNPFRHGPICRYKDKEEKAFLDFLYLYREFKSEAIRILLPVSEFNAEEKISSLIAAIYLGLKEKFKGDISHLETALSREPEKSGRGTRTYLVLYDRVPGGTGYLKELMSNPSTLLDTFKLAVAKLKGCGCQKSETHTDGCYRCIYAYKTSFDMPLISRTEALKLLEALLSRQDKIETIASVEDIESNHHFDSELEAQFIEALKSVKYGGQALNVQAQRVRSKSGYFLTIGGRDGQGGRGYNIEPQVKLNERDGVSEPCEADFVFWPARSGTLPIAVFTDGYTFHGNPKNGNYSLHKDLLKRDAIRDSGKFIVWSLSYDDVQNAKKDRSEHFENLVVERRDVLRKLLARGEGKGKRFGPELDRGAFHGLLEVLAEPDLCGLREFAKVWAIGTGSMKMKGSAIKTDSKAAASVYEKLRTSGRTTGFLGQDSKAQGATHLVMKSAVDQEGTVPVLHQVASLKVEDLASSDYKAVSYLMRVYDDEPDIEANEFRKVWSGILRSHNWLQFLPNAWFVTSRGIDLGMYPVSGLLVESNSEKEPEVPPVSADWSEVLEDVDTSWFAIVKELSKCEGVPLPEVGFPLVGQKGEVLGEAELGWEQAKVACFLEDSEGNAEAFKEAGWVVFETPVGLKIEDLEGELLK